MKSNNWISQLCHVCAHVRARSRGRGKESALHLMDKTFIYHQLKVHHKTKFIQSLDFLGVDNGGTRSFGRRGGGR